MPLLSRWCMPPMCFTWNHAIAPNWPLRFYCSSLTAYFQHTNQTKDRVTHLFRTSNGSLVHWVISPYSPFLPLPYDFAVLLTRGEVCCPIPWLWLGCVLALNQQTQAGRGVQKWQHLSSEFRPWQLLLASTCPLHPAITDDAHCLVQSLREDERHLAQTWTKPAT